MRTRKTLDVTLTCIFEGDYIDVESLVDYLDGWIDSGLDDRDDLRGWHAYYGPITEEEMDDDE